MAGRDAPPSKRRKTLNSKTEPENPNPQSCAVCYTDDVVRGITNCCDHYFCFSCITQWAKSETRCPVCRLRFTSIRRPPKAGVFVRWRTVKVPVRDQVYIPDEEDEIAQIQSYYNQQVLCSVCNFAAEDGVVLTCGDCHAAAHRDCVGIGDHVFEGGWFCYNCSASRDLAIAITGDDYDVGRPTAVPTAAVNGGRGSNMPNALSQIRNLARTLAQALSTITNDASAESVT